MTNGRTSISLHELPGISDRRTLEGIFAGRQLALEEVVGRQRVALQTPQRRDYEEVQTIDDYSEERPSPELHIVPQADHILAKDTEGYSEHVFIERADPLNGIALHTEEAIPLPLNTFYVIGPNGKLGSYTCLSLQGDFDNLPCERIHQKQKYGFGPVVGFRTIREYEDAAVEFYHCLRAEGFRGDQLSMQSQKAENRTMLYVGIHVETQKQLETVLRLMENKRLHSEQVSSVVYVGRGI